MIAERKAAEMVGEGEWLRIRQVQTLLGVSYSTVFSFIQDGMLEAMRLYEVHGQPWLVRATDVAALVAEKEKGKCTECKVVLGAEGVPTAVDGVCGWCVAEGKG